MWDSKRNDFVEGFELQFPCFISPKIDGIRCGIQNATALSYTGKPIRNKATYEQMSLSMYDGLDFEFTIGDWAEPDVFNKTTRAIMTGGGEPEFQCHIFDEFSTPDEPYWKRLEGLRVRVDVLNGNFFGRDPFKVVPQVLVNNYEELMLQEQEFISLGFEGAMTRLPDAKYKFGRATLREQNLLKLKRFSHTEAKIIGYEEEMENTNPTFYDVYGKAVKSNTKDAKSGKGRLGKYICVCPEYEEQFSVSCTTMPHAERLERWQTREKDIGKYIRFKHLKHGEKDKPRHPMYAGLRDKSDFMEKGHEF